MTAKPGTIDVPKKDPEAEPLIGSTLKTPMLITVPTPPSHLPMSMPSDDATFDAWLRLALTEAHDAILHDPVPERLLRILMDPPGH